MTPLEIEQQINELEKDIDRLHALYNQYFMGIEKIEPSTARKNLDRKINALRREQIQNTAMRFRLQMQIQKYNSQSTYWNRICRQIENGTYVRQVALAKRRVKARHPYSENPPTRSSIPPIQRKSDLEEAFHIDLDEFGMDISDPLEVAGFDSSQKNSLTLDDPFADVLPSVPDQNNERPSANLRSLQTSQSAKGPSTHEPTFSLAKSNKASPATQQVKVSPKSPPPPPPKVSRPSPVPAKPVKQPPPPIPEPQVDQEKLKTIYRRYLAARKKCNEPTGDLTFNLVADSLKKRIQSANGQVDFKVVIRGGKAVIKTIKADR